MEAPSDLVEQQTHVPATEEKVLEQSENPCIVLEKGNDQDGEGVEFKGEEPAVDIPKEQVFDNDAVEEVRSPEGAHALENSHLNCEEISSGKKLVSTHYTLSSSPIVVQIDRKSDIFSDSQKKSLVTAEPDDLRIPLTKEFEEPQKQEAEEVSAGETGENKASEVAAPTEELEKTEMKIEQNPASVETSEEIPNTEEKGKETENEGLDASKIAREEDCAGKEGPAEENKTSPSASSNRAGKTSPEKRSVDKKSAGKKRAMSPEKRDSSSNALKAFSSRNTEGDNAAQPPSRVIESIKKGAQESLDRILSSATSTGLKTQHKENVGPTTLSKSSHYKICPQCQGELDGAKMKVKTLACTHKFHEDCLGKMNQKSCPTCTNSFASKPSEKELTKKTPIKN